MSLVSNLISVLGSIESDAVCVHEERCISVRNRNADCLRCAESCTSGALSYVDGEMKVDQSACIGCGTCATACPTCAIEVRHPSDEELVKYVKSAIVASKGHPVIACSCALDQADARAALRHGRSKKEAAYDMAQICAVPCLGRIDESLLVGLGAYKSHDVTLVCGACESCVHAAGGAMVREVIPSAASMLAAFGSPLKITLTNALPDHVRECSSNGRAVAQGGEDRRDFFRSMKERGAQAIASAADGGLRPDVRPTAAYQKVGEDGTLSHFVPQRRIRVYNYLKHIGEPVRDSVKTRIIGRVSIDTDLCASCRMCAVFCPTGAIEKHDGDFFGIVHRPAKCVQCRLCESICPVSAIKVDDEVPIEHFVGKRAVAYRMKEPEWTPNRPESMYAKVHSALGDDLEMCAF